MVQPTRDIEDNYPEYLADTYGYAYDADDIVSIAAIRRHEALRRLDAQGLEAVEVASLDDYQRWALGQAYLRHGDLDGFLRIGALLLQSTDDHPALVYREISLRLADTLVEALRIREATSLLGRHLERWPDDLAALQLRAVIDVVADRSQTDRLDALAEAHADDPDFFVEVAELLGRLGQEPTAREWLDRAEACATRVGDGAIGVDIALLRDALGEAEAPPET